MSYRPPYPYVRILGGFILGNVILTALLYLLLRPGFLAGRMMPFDPPYSLCTLRRCRYYRCPHRLVAIS